MLKKIIIACLLLVSTTFGHDGHDHNVHLDDPVKRAEHLAAIGLVTPSSSVTVSGKSSARTFLPTDDLYIPEGSEFVIDGDLDVRRIRFDGTLRVSTKSLTIRVETIVGNTTGHLSMPTSANHRTISIKGRGPRDRIGDPTDIAGGIILHSKDNVIAGQSKTAWVIPIAYDIVNKKIYTLNNFKNWKVGDELLLPRVRWSDPDEIVTISAIGRFGEITVSSLTSDHKLPDGSYAPVGNLTRNLTITSENTEISQRGHIMIMHEHTGTVIDSVAITNLGRTTVESIPTKIVLDADGKFVSGDENTIGRYPLHAHGRSGANLTDTPHKFTNNVVRGSPTHGIVNHGSNISAQYNVVYDCFGSNLFGENGLELGDFTKNLAVLSKGRQTTQVFDDLNAFNFGWEGTTLWLQGPGMTAIDNHLYGAKHALMKVDFTMVPDGGGQFDYPVAYIPDGPHKDAIMAGRFVSSANKTKVGIHQVPAYWAGNTGAGSENGLFLLHIQYDTKSPGDGRIHTKFYEQNTAIVGFRMFNVDTGSNGTYIGHLHFLNCRFDGNMKLTNFLRPYTGTPNGTKVHNVYFDFCEFRNFQIGVIDRGWSDLYINNCTFENNLIDMQIIMRNTVLNSHDVQINNPTFLGKPTMAAIYATKNPAVVWGKPKNYWFVDQCPENSKVMVYETFYPNSHTIDGKMLYYPDNLDTFVPFLGVPSPNHIYNGLNNLQLWNQFQKAVSGRRFNPAAAQQLNIDSNIPIYTVP